MLLHVLRRRVRDKQTGNIAADIDDMTTGICVYLTDGYGTFPDTAPELPVLWVVTPGGLDLS